jgi:hypothetical protein
VHLSQDQTIKVVGDSRIDFVNFTGSVANGHLITKAASESFKGLALEVRRSSADHEASLIPIARRKGSSIREGGRRCRICRQESGSRSDFQRRAELLQCRGMELLCDRAHRQRIYVHERVYDEFIERVRQVKAFVLHVHS